MFDVSSLHLVARSLQVDKFRIGLIAAIAAVVATNSTLLIVTVGAAGRPLVLLLTFASALLPIFLLFFHLIESAGRNLEALRVVGATRRRIVLSLLAGLVAIGGAGAAAGVASGTLILHLGLAFALLPTAAAQPSPELFLYVLSSSVGGVTTGALAGARRAWEGWY